MKLKRFGHILICFFLICALLVNVSPLRVHAVATEIAIGAALAVLGVAGALGVSFANEAAFQTFFDSCSVSLESGGFFSFSDNIAYANAYIVDGLSYVSYDLISAIQSLLYSTGTLSTPYGFHSANSGFTFSNGRLVYPTESYLSFIASYSNNYGNNCLFEMILISDSCSIYNSDYSSSYYTSNVTVNGVRYSYYALNSVNVSDISSAGINLGTLTSSSSDIAAAIITAYLSGSYAVTAVEGVLLGERVSAPEYTEEDLQEIVWIDPIIWEQIPDGSGDGGDDGNDGEDDGVIKHFPVTFPPEFVPNYSQDEAQTGQTEIDTDTDTDTGGDTGTDAGGDAGTDTGGIVSWLDPLINTLESLLKRIFVPSEDFLSEKVLALRARFGFADSIISTVEAIGATLEELVTGPPVIYIDLSAATGSYYWGDRIVFVDLSWYAPYKPTVDLILSAFLWLVFIWRIFLKLPGIINGMPGDWVMKEVDKIGVSNLPTRSMDMAVSREKDRQEVRRRSK